MSTRVLVVAEKHLKLRWIGLPFFLSGLVLFGLALVRTSSFFPIAIGLACTLMGLTCFGVNHDTAIALAIDAHKEDDTAKMSTALRAEVDEELQRNRSETLALQPSPIVGVVLPFVVFIVQVLEIYLLFGK